MSNFLIDSDIVIWYLKGRGQELKLLEDLSNQGDLSISVVTLTEVRAGLRKNVDETLMQLKTVFEPVFLNIQMAELAGSFRQRYSLSIADMLIAATAIVSGSFLVTYNRKHFPMPQVRLYLPPRHP